MDLAVGILVEHVEQVAGAAGKAEDMLAGIQVFPSAGDDALFHHGAHQIGEHLRVDAQILLVHQRSCAGVGQRTDAQLDGVAVPDQLRHI